MNWMCAVALIASLAAQDSPALWRQYAEKLPLGSAVTVRATGGDRLTASLLAVDDTGITVKPRTREPEPLRHIRYDQLEQLELKTGAPYAQRLGVGIAVGFGVTWAGIFLIIAGMSHR